MEAYSKQWQLKADGCIQLMHDVWDGYIKERAQPTYVAAALALLLGFHRKKNGKPNPTDAARAFGIEISRPSAVTQWFEQLEQLEQALLRQCG